MSPAQITAALENARFPSRDSAAAYWNSLMRDSPNYTLDCWLVPDPNGSWALQVREGPGNQFLLEIKKP